MTSWWHPTTRATTTGEVEAVEAVEEVEAVEATIGRTEMMRRTTEMPTIFVLTESELLAMTGGSHRGVITMLEMITTEGGSYSLNPITTKTRAITGNFIARSSTTETTEAETTQRPTNGTLKRIGPGD